MQTVLSENTQIFKHQLENEFGFAKIPYPKNLRTASVEYLKALIRFCNQPLEHKLQIPFEKGVGYEYKEVKMNAEKKREDVDNKENFHIRKNYALPKGHTATDEDRTLVEAGLHLIGESMPTILHVSEMFSEMTGKDFVSFAANEFKLTLRGLHYFSPFNKPAPDHNNLANWHPDKGVFTIPLIENYSGLHGEWKGKYIPMNVTLEELLVFCGIVGQHYTDGLAKALRHGVIPHWLTEIFDRYSVVMFNDGTLGLVYNKDKYGPISQYLKDASYYDQTPSKFVENLTEEKVRD